MFIDNVSNYYAVLIIQEIFIILQNYCFTRDHDECRYLGRGRVISYK